MSHCNIALAPNEEVLVLTAENQIKQPFEVVGIISYDNLGKVQILSLGDAIETGWRECDHHR